MIGDTPPSEFESRAHEFLQTLRALAQVRGGPVAKVLAKGSAQIHLTGYDNWNGGTDIYAFELIVPPRDFAEIEGMQKEVEQTLLDQLKNLIRTESGIWLTDVIIRPGMPQVVEIESESEAESLWKPGCLRLFLSHTSSQRKQVDQLRIALEPFLVSGFVAHVNIEPTQEWQVQIEAALRTMDVLLAVVGPDFVSSKWCDQEVGFAMGRGKLILSLKAGADPHGFIGKFQAVPGEGRKASEIAPTIFQLLAAKDQTRRQVAALVTEAFLTATSWEEVKHLIALLEKLPSMDQDLVDRVGSDWRANEKIASTYGVSARLERLLNRR